MPSRSQNPVICFAGDNYRFSNPHSRYHLMHALHRQGHTVLWVNSIGMNMPKLRRRGFLKRGLMKLRSWMSWLYTAEPGFHVLTPIALPLFGNRLVESLNNRWMAFQVGLARRLLHLREPVVFASIPSFARIAVGIPHSGLIYYYSDKYDSYRDISARKTIAEYDRLLFESADAVFCASDQVFRDLEDSRPDVYYLPHAVDFHHFNGAPAVGTPEPTDMASIPHPRIGYFGSLTDSNDQDIIEFAARKNPEHQFVLIGRVLGDYSALSDLPNVHLLGFKSYGELPSYGRCFDVAFMSWKMTEWIRNSNPLKTKEYLSLGLPVVSVRINELELEYNDMVYLIDDGPSFAAAIEQALAEDSQEKHEARINRVASESWDSRAGEMMTLFRKAQNARHD